MIDQTLYDWAPLVVALPTVAFLADFYLTLAGARRYRRVSDRWRLEGSYELNEPWVETVEGGAFTPRVAVAAILLLVVMTAAWLLANGFERNPRLSDQYAYWMFAGAVGAMLLGVQTPILVAHVQNLTRLRLLADPTATSGRLSSARWAAHVQHSANYLAFAVIWAALFAVSLQAFFVAGALGSAFRAVAHWKRSRAMRASAAGAFGSSVPEQPSSAVTEQAPSRLPEQP